MTKPKVNLPDTSELLKRLINAAEGRPLSWSLSMDINKMLGTTYSGGDKLGKVQREHVKALIAEMRARGIAPAKTLLTECQQKAQRKKKRMVTYGM